MLTLRWIVGLAVPCAVSTLLTEVAYSPHLKTASIKNVTTMKVKL